MGFVVAPVIEKFDSEGIEYENSTAVMIDSSIIEKSWEIKALFGRFRYLNLLFIGYKMLSVRKPFYELIKNHLESGMKYDDLFKKLIKKLPKEVVGQYNNLGEMMSLSEYQEIKSLYDATTGLSEDEKLESMFRSIKADEIQKNIRIMSIHKSKGLGADYVFILGLTEGMLPNKKDGLDSIEAQRRLFYVGVTRAKKCLSVVSILKIPGKYVNKINKNDFSYDFKNKLYNGKASSFINELKL
jgi:superfamily I DNA/RNA helicase